MFSHIKAGDTVTRMLAGEVPMQLRVTEVDDTLIYCGKPGSGWSFDRQTGAELDEDLGWGPAYGITGSFLTLPATAAGCHAKPCCQPFDCCGSDECTTATVAS